MTVHEGPIVLEFLLSLTLMSDPPVVTDVNETRSETGRVEYASIGGASTMRVTFLDRPKSDELETGLIVLDDTAQVAPSQWQVQLGAFDSEAIAIENWQSLQAEFEAILSQRDRFLQPVSLDDGRELVRLRASGYADRTSAVEACEELQTSGQACFVASVG